MILQKTLDDSRKHTDPLPQQEFSIPSSQGRFVKFELVSFYGNGGGLQYFNINNKGPKVVKEKSSKYDSRFPAEKLLTKSLKEEFAKNYWILPDRATGKGFMIDFRIKKSFNMVKLKNTHNAHAKDRSTKEFKIYIRSVSLVSENICLFCCCKFNTFTMSYWQYYSLFIVMKLRMDIGRWFYRQLWLTAGNKLILYQSRNSPLPQPKEDLSSLSWCLTMAMGEVCSTSISTIMVQK